MWRPKILSFHLYWAMPAVLACWLLPPVSAQAESAEDVATARRTATEGIRLFQQGDFAGALERMERAQALYDVPVHRLFIARAQVKLNRWVEGAETYRKLSRLELDAKAPKEFVSAIESAKTELAELEPKIPTLRVVVKPETAKGITVTLDGRELPAAAVGIERPSDPGKHTLVARGVGAEAQERSVTLAAASKEEEVFTFAAASTGAASVSEKGAKTAVGEAKTKPEDKAKAGSKAAAPEKKKPFQLEFMAGLRLGLSAPNGDSVATVGVNEKKNLSMGELAGTGGGLELRGGVRFHPNLTGVLYFDASTVPGGTWNPYPTKVVTEDVKFSRSASWTNFGLGVVASMDPKELGVFGEVDLVLASSLTAKHTFTSPDVCKGDVNTFTLSGSALRLGGGLNIPTKIIGTLTPLLTATVGKFGTAKPVLGCGEKIRGVGMEERANPTVNGSKLHSLVFLGIGSELHFGGN
ncbi:MAG: hypothetical protein SFV15_01560 [Polyangiaceae bacterium]|nr:hypothetical protein [Polyangiaceae bacterium]